MENCIETIELKRPVNAHFLKKVRNNENIIFLKNPPSKERITDIQSNMSTVVDIVVGCERGEGERKVNRF